eukprot:CAMPEP_0170515694 /NCGR_PEP_ID=MMETSP0209-20121228/2094_1 /TAXON_ID=665100 ORGANISM="Litonotus pictus, Strain P1" /NCGR_SAMPLE_ID=MMETSP0209 /ASSEMBLY_ACC=CAM_ASM_000301 /LENGTH=773 /DNA_ID=CAMNT_0010800291 /DNA_START=318 /DNA_END=2636 /DNA_ORIENTATION=+
MKQSYFSNLKDLLPQLSMVFHCPFESILNQDEKLQEKISFYKMNQVNRSDKTNIFEYCQSYEEVEEERKKKEDEELKRKLKVKLTKGPSLSKDIEDQENENEEAYVSPQNSGKSASSLFYIEQNGPNSDFDSFKTKDLLSDQQTDQNIADSTNKALPMDEDLIRFEENGYVKFIASFLKEQGVEQKYLKDFLINKYINLVREHFNAKASKNTDIKKDIKVSHENHYSREEFFVFIRFLATMIFFLTGIESKFFIDELGNFNLDLFASENLFQVIAEELRYRLQRRIIAQTETLDYNIYEEDLEEEEENNQSESNEVENKKEGDDCKELQESLLENPHYKKELIEGENSENQPLNIQMGGLSEAKKTITDNISTKSALIKNNAENVSYGINNTFQSSLDYFSKIYRTVSSSIKTYFLNLINNFVETVDTVKENISPTTVMKEISVKTSKIMKVLVKKAGVLDDDENEEIEAPQNNIIDLINIIPQEHLDEDLANFPPYYIFKCCYQHQRIFKRFDKQDHNHLCNNCPSNSRMLISKSKCSTDCAKTYCKTCNYLQYRLIIQECKNYLSINDIETDIIDDTKVNLALDEYGCNNAFVKNGSCSSLFRQIDKMRLLFHKMNNTFEFKKAKKRANSNKSKEVLIGIFNVYDYESYIPKLNNEYNDSFYTGIKKEIELSKEKEKEKDRLMRKMSKDQGVSKADIVAAEANLDSKIEDEEEKELKNEILKEEKKNEESEEKGSILQNFALSLNESPVVLSFIFQIRNLYGEEVAFYFAW